MNLPMDTKSKLKRFCCLGSFEPVYTHLRRDPNVNVLWSQIEPMVKTISDTEFIPFLRELLTEVHLVRKDETLFVYAAYLASTVDDKWKTAVRQAFPVLLATEDDLFLFCKYASLIAKEQMQKVFSKTVRKAITAWYASRTPEAIRLMWTEHRGLHGFTHRVLFKLCHISDDVLGCPNEIVKPFFKTCTQILKENNETVAPPSKSDQTLSASAGVTKSSSNATIASTESLPKDDEKMEDKMERKMEKKMEKKIEEKMEKKIEEKMEEKSENKVEEKMEVEQQQQASSSSKSSKCAPSNLFVAISKLRHTKSKHEAIKIIRKFKLRYNQVPGHLVRFPVIMEAMLPTMSYLQILKCWRKMARYHHLKNEKFFTKIKKLLGNKESFKKNRLYPIHILLNLRKAASTSDKSKLPPKRQEALRLNYLESLYNDSYLWHQESGNLRMLITVNLQENYKKKMLKNHKNLSYLDAAWALAYGYFKREAHVDIFHWVKEKLSVQQILIDKEAKDEDNFKKFNTVNNLKNYQILANPLTKAIATGVTYDVFLCIVPTAGRGNPKQNSDYLCKFVDRYREVNNPKAKFVILDLLKYKRSMQYNMSRCQNILEICGLDEHTTDIIYNFATHRFD